MSFGDTSRGFSEWSLGGIDLTLDDFGPEAMAFEDVRTATPLSEAALLTNTRVESSLGSELRAWGSTAVMKWTCSAPS